MTRIPALALFPLAIVELTTAGCVNLFNGLLDTALRTEPATGRATCSDCGARVAVGYPLEVDSVCW